MGSETPPIKIGEILVQCGMIDPHELERALEYGRQEKLRLGEALVALGILDEDRLTWALGAQFDLSYVDLQPGMIDWSLLEELPLNRLQDLHVVPLSRVGGEVTLVTSDPARKNLAREISELFPYDRVTIQISSEEAIFAILNEAERQANQSTSSDAGQSLDGLPPTKRLLAAFDEGGTERLLVVRQSGNDSGAIFGGTAATEGSGRVPPAAMQRLARRIEENFTLTMSLPGGGSFLRPCDDTQGACALRALMMTGVSGWMAALARLPEAPPERVESKILLLEGANPVQVKAEVLRALASRGVQELPVFSLESRVDFLVREIFQCELPDMNHRIAAAAHLLEMVRPPALLIEMESHGEASRLLTLPAIAEAGPVFVVLRTPAEQTVEGTLPTHLRRIHVPTSPDALREQIERLAAEEM